MRMRESLQKFDIDRALKIQRRAGGYAYLAAPYFCEDKAITLQRVSATSRIAGNLIARGLLVYSPITHGHAIAEAASLPGSFGYWSEHSGFMLSYANSMIIVQLGGWQDSEGIEEEIKMSIDLETPIYAIDPLDWLNPIF